MRLLLLLLVATAVALSSGCDLSNSASLSNCLKTILNDARPEVKKRADPLKIPDRKQGDFTIEDATIIGLSQYKINDLKVTTPTPGAAPQVSVTITLSWPSIKGNVLLNYRPCVKLFGRPYCFTLTAKPEVTITDVVGGASTTLTITFGPDGKITVKPHGTKINLSLSDISIKANLQGGLGGLIGGLLGDGVDQITSFIANTWWAQNKGFVEVLAVKALKDVIEKHATFELAKLIKLNG